MKNILFILLVTFASSFLFAQSYAQSNNGGAVGIRIGNTSSGKMDVSTEGEVVMAGYMVYDENENLVESGVPSSANKASVDVDSLESGLYYVVVVSESGEVGAKAFVKEEE